MAAPSHRGQDTTLARFFGFDHHPRDVAEALARKGIALQIRPVEP